MKYFIQGKSNKRHPNAGGKANIDCNKILQENGYQSLSWRTNYPLHILKYFAEFIFYIKLLIKTSIDDTILLQWPDYTIRYIDILYKVLSHRRHIEVLIHDINTLRNEFARSNHMEKAFFTMAEKLIVHTPAMKEYVCSQGINPNNVTILTSFDYLSDYPMNKDRQKTNVVVFAGNLQKSTFLNKISKQEYDNLTFNCYGRFKGEIGDACNYLGSFMPDDTSKLEGSWGLVWDGDSTDYCSGDLGEYLRYNSPHKLSLYLSAGLPLIVWKEAALANYVQSNNLGIAVNNIKEIASIIETISDEDYKTILSHVQTEGESLRRGEHLRSCIL